MLNPKKQKKSKLRSKRERKFLPFNLFAFQISLTKVCSLFDFCDVNGRKSICSINVSNFDDHFKRSEFLRCEFDTFMVNGVSTKLTVKQF